MKTWKPVVGCLLFASLCACATGNRVVLRPMTDVQADSIVVGSRPADIRAMLGEPHYLEEVEFGAETEEPWDGVVFVYLGEIDESLIYSTRYRSNRFAFALVGGDTLLNHWEINAIASAE